MPRDSVHACVDQGRDRPVADAALQMRLRLIDDLHVSPRLRRGVADYQIELPMQGKFFRVGRREFALLSRLSSQRTVGDAWRLSNAELQDEALTAQEVAQVCRWAVTSGLAQICGANGGALPTTDVGHPPPASWNPFWIKLSLGSPQSVIASLAPCLGWVHSPGAMSLALGLFAAATFSVATNWQEFMHQTRSVFGSSNWIWIAAAWFVLKLLHETAHALVCRRHGGHVRDWGVALVLFVPMPYVDVTASWRFPGRWQRMQTALAGIYIELLVAAVCVFGWLFTESPLTRQILHTTIVTASITTVLFNANPLMRFDGYFLLCDLLRIPNLYGLGAAAVASAWRRLLLGEIRPCGVSSSRERLIVTLYGWAASFWRMLVCLSLVLAASALFDGAGVVLAGFGIAAWTKGPVVRTARLLVRLLTDRPMVLVRAAAVMTGLTAAVYSAVFELPLTGFCVAPAIVRYANPIIVRSESAGFVDEVLVKNGQAVAAGDLLIRLRNEELNADVEELRLVVGRAELKASMLLQKGDIGAAVLAQDEVALLGKHLQQKEQQQAALCRRAPKSGIVLARNLSQLEGRHVAADQALLTLVDERRLELTATVSQDQADQIADVHARLSFFDPERGWRDVGETRVDPRADRRPPHQALTAPCGGPLPA
ncbi:MAG: HlyD family efflux transporter periplasmic adaptor subunit, partial [Planctomycetaceae bacterium]